MYKLLLLSILLAVLPCGLAAEKWTPETLPMVHLQDARRYVCNPDDVLTQAAVDSADAILQAMERDKGVQTVVVVVKQLKGDDPYQFGMELGRKYGIGSKTQRTGLIVILATEDRSYQILTGNGLEGTLPDAICRRIQNRVMVPQLKRKNWDAAIVGTLKSIDGYVRGDETLRAELSDDGDTSDMLAGLLIAIVLGGAMFCFALIGYAHRRCPKCKQGHLRVVRRQRVRINGSPVWRIQVTLRCPRCGYEKTEYHDENNVHGSSIPPLILGGGLGRGGGGFGGGSFGGSFGGGSFGGGGSGGRF